MPADAKSLLARYERLLSRRRLYEEQWEQIAEVISPRRVGIISKRTPGEKRTRNLLDSTAVRAVELLSSSLHGTLTPPSLRWFSLTFRDEAVNEDKAVMDWREDAAERMFLAFGQSTWDLHVQEVYLDMVAFGQAAILVEEREPEIPGFNGLRFMSLPIGTYVIDENGDGQVDTVMREFTITARAAADRWGQAALTAPMKDALDKEPERTFTIVHVVTPRQEGDRQGRGRALPIMSVWIERSSRALIGREAGYHEMPIMTPRWSKSSGEQYGTGPGHTALPDAQSLNQVRKLYFRQWELAIQPPTLEQWNNVQGPLKWVPGGRNVVRDASPTGIREMITGARFDATASGVLDLRNQIREIFFVDQLALKEEPRMTALEVQVRFELMQRILGPSLGRFTGELFNPLIERVFGIMARAGAFRPIPQVLQEYIRRIGTFDVEYQSPMARAQRAPDVIAIERSLQSAAAVLPVKPDLLDNVDLDKSYRHIWTVNGAPSDLLRGEEDVLRLRAARAQQMQAAQAAQGALQVTEGARNVAPLVKALAGNGAGQEVPGGAA